jgi:hypothetical protein
MDSLTRLLRRSILILTLLVIFPGSSPMTRFSLSVAILFAGLAGTAFAQAPDPTGTWKWTVSFQDQTREMTLKLKLEGDKLTGAVLRREGQETKIEDAKYKDGELSFAVTRERNGQKFTTKYKGKIEGDTIKGKQESERNGQVRSRDWEAKRVKEEAKAETAS